MGSTAMEIPSTQKAAVKQGSGDSSTVPVTTVSVEKPGPGEILVKISWSGLCHSDMSFIYDEWTDIGAAMQPASKNIPGHEGAGTVVAVADDVTDLWSVGDRAGIKWVTSTCGKCDFCREGIELHCPNQTNSGFSVPGTFQEYVVTNARYATKLPDGVKDEEAGPIMCGGLTSYSALKRSNVRPGEWIVLPGAGGGLGHFGVQYAKAMGMRVIAVDGGEEKEKLCKQLGAEHFIDFQTTKDVAAEVMKITKHGAHGVVVTAASKEGYAQAPTFLRPRGTMVAIGLPKDMSVIAGASPMLLINRMLNVVGSMVGDLKDVDEALDFTVRGLVHPVLTKGKLGDVDEFCQRMRAGKLAGRAVLKIGE